MKYLGDFIEKQPCSWLEKAKKCRKKNSFEFNNIAEEISKRYSDYDHLINSISTPLIESKFSDNSDLIIEYYESPPKELNILLLERRNEHKLISCPYCGNPSTPDTLDHFIPKGNWPEFSIFPNNLVPQCRGCAPIKSEKHYCNKNNKAMFIHPFYFGFIEKFRFCISLTFNKSNNNIIVSVKLKKDKDIAANEKERFLLHAEELKIKSRINRYCLRNYNEWIRRLSNTNFDITLALQQRLKETPPKDIGKEWKSAFYKALLENPEAIQYMNSLCPKQVQHQYEDDGEEIDFD